MATPRKPQPKNSAPRPPAKPQPQSATSLSNHAPERTETASRRAQRHSATSESTTPDHASTTAEHRRTVRSAQAKADNSKRLPGA